MLKDTSGSAAAVVELVYPDIQLRRYADIREKLKRTQELSKNL